MKPRSQRRIFHLIKSLGRGGAETLLVQCLAAARREQFEYRYGYFLPWKDALVGEIESQGAEVTCFSANNNRQLFARIPAVVRALRSWRADAVHCHLPLAGVVGRLAGRLAGVPVVYTEHNLMERYHPWTRRLNVLTWRLQQHVIAVSREVADAAHRHCGDRVPITVVPNGVSLARFDPSRIENSARSALSIPAGAPVVGTCAVFREQKRLDLWLEIARAVREATPTAQFLLVGDGPLRSELQRRANELSLNGCVHFCGLQDDVRPFLAAMDVYLMSSDFEGLPIALLEAMAMERAIVSTDVGGIPEVLVHGSNGMVTERRDTGALIDGVRAMLESPTLRETCGRNARKTVSEQFSVETMVERTERLYASVC